MAITAIQSGDRARGRQLLLELLDDGERNETAWLWLSRVVDDADDERVALENVLTLNPHNEEARRRLDELLAPAPQTAHVKPADQAVTEAAPQEIEDDMDSPLLCVACARPTAEADRKCPHCGQNLIIRVRRSSHSEYLKLSQLLLGIHLALGLIPLVGPMLAWATALSPGQPGGGRAVFQALTSLHGADLILANFAQWNAALARTLAIVFGGRLAFFGVLLLGLSQRWAWTFYLTLIALIADLGLNLFLLANGYLGWAPGMVNMLMALAVLYLTGSSYQEFSVTAQRLYNLPDSDLHTAGAFYQRGREYGKLGLWGLAVAQWRKAVGLAPRETLYYKELGLGYARIKRYARSLRVLEEAARQAPGDRQIPEIIALVRQQMERAAGQPAKKR